MFLLQSTVCLPGLDLPSWGDFPGKVIWKYVLKERSLLLLFVFMHILWAKLLLGKEKSDTVSFLLALVRQGGRGGRGWRSWKCDPHCRLTFPHIGHKNSKLLLLRSWNLSKMSIKLSTWLSKWQMHLTFGNVQKQLSKPGLGLGKPLYWTWKPFLVGSDLGHRHTGKILKGRKDEPLHCYFWPFVC